MSKKVIMIGAVALGSKAACRFKRLEPDADVLMIDSDKFISYGGCGIPYYVSGDVSEYSQLQATSFHMVRDEKFFKNVKNIRALTSTTALSINRDNKTVHVRYNDNSKEHLSYDKLVIGTGSVPRNLNISGQDLKNVYCATNLNEAIAIKELIAKGSIEKAVVIGAGFIGLEMAEAICDMWGIETSVVEISNQIMPGFVSKSFSMMAIHQMKEKGISFYLDEKVVKMEGSDVVQRVQTDKRTIEADLVILAAGITPNSKLAKDAGLDVSDKGTIIVNEMLQTSDPDIYSGGDCVECINQITGKPIYLPLGSIANRQGRVIGSNLAGKKATFDGGVGSFVVKLFETSLCGAGLTIENAIKNGYDAVSVQMAQLDRAHFYPSKELMFLELVVEKPTKRVLGIQGFGSDKDATVGRINTVAAILKYMPSVQDISNLEFAYSPPFSSAMDIVNALGNTAENLIDGIFAPLNCETFVQHWNERDKNDLYFIDCRTFPDAKPYVEKYPGDWNSIPQEELRKRINDVPKDKKIVLVCNTGVRSYEAQLNLREFGINNTVTLEGGVAMLKKIGWE